MLAMDKIKFEILPTALLAPYGEKVAEAFLSQYQKLEESELSMEAFSFYTSVSAVYSSKIEGENIELDSYVKHKRFGVAFLPDYTRKIDDLYHAYQTAQKTTCDADNIFVVHQILTRHILQQDMQGKLRTGNMYVTTPDGRIEYVAPTPFKVADEMEKFYQDLNTLRQMPLTLQEVFFYAAMLHLVFVKIHPFEDGNGRASRLIEKWFLAEKLGEKAWLIQSEKYYYLNHQTYYKNLRAMGLEYETLDYSKALPFLMMLPQSLILNEPEQR